MLKTKVGKILLRTSPRRTIESGLEEGVRLSGPVYMEVGDPR